jgi:predicted transcriptional regulator
MKTIINIAPPSSVFAVTGKQIRKAQTQRKQTDYHLSFESARTLFSELSPARIDLLESLRRTGPSSVYALAKATQRNATQLL